MMFGEIGPSSECDSENAIRRGWKEWGDGGERGIAARLCSETRD